MSKFVIHFSANLLAHRIQRARYLISDIVLGGWNIRFTPIRKFVDLNFCSFSFIIRSNLSCRFWATFFYIGSSCVSISVVSLFHSCWLSRRYKDRLNTLSLSSDPTSLLLLTNYTSWLLSNLEVAVLLRHCDRLVDWYRNPSNMHRTADWVQ